MDWSDVSLMLAGGISALIMQDVWRWLSDRPRRWATENPNPAPKGPAPVVQTRAPVNREPKATPAPPRPTPELVAIKTCPACKTTLVIRHEGNGPAA